ncbi:hypothetical protein M0R45_029400 [Rubus argutus]|uniref:Cell number regulator 8-like n=1 Tax=Rubus argutus TaxID=59490 RepID=A0AAW1WA22_RUBAR
MASNRERNVQEESNPLLSSHQQFEEPQKEAEKPAKAAPATQPDEKSPVQMGQVNGGGNGCGWTADGLPLTHGSVVGEPLGRNPWDSDLLACLGRNDEFCSSDLEVCLLGSVAPCVLYGTNAERLSSSTGSTFASHCLTYSGLYLIGNAFFGWNCLAPFFAARNRTAMRHKFNLQGGCEAFQNSCGCCGSMGNEDQEQCEAFCDVGTHLFCHPCALCQEGREVRRRLPHPGFNAQPVLVMIPPGEQAMGRGA